MATGTGGDPFIIINGAKTNFDNTIADNYYKLTLNTSGLIRISGSDAYNYPIETINIFNSNFGYVTQFSEGGSIELSSGTYYVQPYDRLGGTFSVNSNVLIGGTINNAPIITSGSIGTVFENQPITTVIYDANATDVDAFTTLSYSVSGTDMSLLNINSTNGMVTLKASANYEAKNSYSFNVIASDGALNAIKAVIVAVTDVYEASVIPTTALAHLATYSVTIQQAHDYIVANLASPSTIYDTCSQYRVSNQMIVEIFDNAYSIDTVKGYFLFNGLNAASLDMFV